MLGLHIHHRDMSVTKQVQNGINRTSDKSTRGSLGGTFRPKTYHSCHKTSRLGERGDVDGRVEQD